MTTIWLVIDQTKTKQTIYYFIIKHSFNIKFSFILCQFELFIVEDLLWILKDLDVHFLHGDEVLQNKSIEKMDQLNKFD
jgi:hypothetical protein